MGYVIKYLMEKGMAYDFMPFPSNDCPVPDVGNIYLVRND